MRPPLTALLIALPALGAAGVGAWKASAVSGTALALFTAAAILTELLAEPRRDRTNEPVARESLHLPAAVHVAAIVVLGPWVAALVAAGGGLAGAAGGATTIARGVFRTATLTVATAAAGVAFGVAGGHAGTLELLGGLVPVVALGVTYTTVRTALLDVGLAREIFDPRIAAAAGEVALGIVIALLAIATPWNVVVVIPLAVAIHRTQVRLARVQQETLRALETFANIVDERDPSTYRHSVRVAAYVDGLARALRLPFSDIDRLRWAGRLHDLGKVAVDAAVLRKPGQLDRIEWAAVRRHPRLSARLLQRFEFVATQAQAVELHHERVDGRGYYGVDGEDLPLAAHFLIVADAYDAMRTDRPYRPGLSVEEALAEIERNIGTQFHPTVAKAFVAVQHGLRPADVLSADELAVIRAAPASYRPGTGGRPLAVAARADVLVFGGIVLGLVGLAFAQRWLEIGAGAATALGLVVHTVQRVRSERLVASLRRSLQAPTKDACFAALVGAISRPWPLTWAGLVGWEEDGLGGRIERAAGGHGPDDTALTSWLVREAESGADVLVDAEGGIGGDGTVVALPLRRETHALTGFLVFQAPRLPPRHVELALRETLDELGLALADRPADPAAPGVLAPAAMARR